ncbi:antibiotic biosynthesis monooxygenase [Nocardioides sp. TRM66260-LWL]|uniref:putative quinol monooxygenase n=1 Tax=Nocardioides sp. TRM66260-LWL TaxID=2874478 RepID=UPI001CC4A1A3|nr:putative quinol monooxygenase [Nocardioides sp. TRM66260-LWL]MBZ5734021.1 antibiotic biosynthesis monooxygenase [Nocardioides sp. TRM66260-LWL]
MSLRVIATIPIKPESVEAARAALQTLVAATRQEDGCLVYDLFESGAAAGTFVTVEEWTDQAALDAHMKAPHIAEAFTVLGGALAGDVAIHPLVAVDA